MKFILYSFALLLTVSSCKSKKAATTTTSTKTNTTTSTNTASATETQKTEPIEIGFQCSACFGKCPEYTLTINSTTKTAILVGVANTEKIGTFSKSISDKELSDMITAFENANFFEFKDEYLGDASDFPSKYTTYTKGGKTKKIRDRAAGPESLQSIERMLINYAEKSEGWEKIKDKAEE